nr:PREDICTED: uncharacterized protein LOC109038017 [Bemisia tabaci]
MPKLSKKNRKSLNNDDIVNLEDEFGSAPSNLNAANVLTAKRNTVYNRVETILKTFEKDLSAENSSQFKIFYERLSTYQEQFDELQAEILSLNASLPDDTQIEFKRTQGKFDSMIHSAETLYLSCCPKIAETVSHDSSASSGASRGRIQLPKLPLPRFSGKLEDWRSFYNLFAASVHNEKELPTVRKFQYLLSSLEGSARDLVKGLDITETNYDVAWKLLCQRYQCERRHIYYHYNGLLGLPEIKDLKHIPNFLTKVREHTQALKGLDHKLQDYSSMLTAVITAKMSFYFRKRFDGYRGADVKYPKLESILDFLEKECLQIESSSMDSSSNKAQAKDSQVSRGTNSTSNPSKSHNSSHKVFLNSEIVESTNTCELCSGNHGLYKCNKFKRLSPSARKSKVIELRRCTNCLSKKHETAACASEYSCRFCKQQHHSLLCSNQRKNVDGASNSNSPPENIKVHLSSEFDTLPSRNFTSLLGTVLLNVKCPDNSYKPVRAIADSGAMSCFISYECVKRLQLPMYATDAEISGIGNQAVKPLGEVKCTLKPRQNSEPILHARATVLSTITDLIPTQPVTPEVRKFWSQLELADPAFDQVGEIDMILGADLFPYILTGERRLTERNGCALQSIYGWIIIGRVSTSKKPKRQKQKSFLSIDGLPLSADFKKFWETEEPQKHHVMSPDDIFCEQQFEKLHYRQPDGRYVVPLLLKNPNPVLPNSRALPEKRLKSVERKLHKQPELKHAYKEFMNEYEQLGHMQLAPSSTEARYYIPHHAVVRENALSTRVRVVFDASMKASNGISLNENLHTGPKLQADIVHLLIRFRTHRVALTGDICKMFRQILIRPGPEDRQYQHILWRDDETSPPKDFELSTVTYGTGPAPYLAHRTMKQHSINERQEFPEACKVLDDAVYTDDIFTGHDTVEETVNLRVEITKCCEKGGFPVKKWSSSHAEVLEGLENGDMAIPLEFHNDAESTHGVVGVKWHPSSDTFSCNEVNLCGKLTKRGILSDIARIFDPLGYITPVALCAKIIIQQL